MPLGMSRLKPLGHCTVLLVTNTWWCEPSIHAFFIFPLLLSAGSSSQSVQYIHLGDQTTSHLTPPDFNWRTEDFEMKLWVVMLFDGTSHDKKRTIKKSFQISSLSSLQLPLTSVTTELKKKHYSTGSPHRYKQENLQPSSPTTERCCSQKLKRQHSIYEKRISIKITKASPSRVSPILGVHHNGTRMTHLSLNESLAGLWSLLQPGNTDSLLRPIVCPVEITSHPVYCYSLYCVDTWDKRKKPVWKMNH